MAVKDLICFKGPCFSFVEKNIYLKLSFILFSYYSHMLQMLALMCLLVIFPSFLPPQINVKVYKC